MKFSEWHSGSDGVQLTKCDKVERGKNSNMQVTYFLIDPMFTLLLCYHFVLYWEKVTSYDKGNHKSKLYGKFQRFSAIDGIIELLKMVEYPKMPSKIKICKTFYKG